MTIRTKVWLKTFGTLKEDSWWYIRSSFICDRLLEVVRWEIPKEDWIIKDGRLQIFLDWSGGICDLPEDRVMAEMDIIGQCTGRSGWAPLKNLADQDLLYTMFNLTQYEYMIKP